jgi:hypothetical protein
MALPPLGLLGRRDVELLFPDRWHKVGLALGLAVVLGFPFSPAWSTWRRSCSAA